VQNERHVSNFSFLYADSPATFVAEAVFSPSYVLGAFVKSQVSIAVCVFISGSCVLFSWSSFLFLCQHHAVFIAMAL
jgi:hypothetical protein